jgi:two-component system, sensor histidine kinase and response regulator
MTTHPVKDTILIVDDNPTNLGALFDYLRGAGFRVLVAENGESALQRVAYAQPDIILLDVLMPGIDGFETCRRLKETEIGRETPVIFLTALSETVDKVKGFAVGGVDYITKPLQYEEVFVRVNTHLTLRKLQKDLRVQIIERDKLIAELNAFSHTVAHDLQGPLGNLIGFASMLKEFIATASLEEIETYAQTIIRNGRKMSNIINELLLLASVRKETVRLTPLDMAAIVTEAQQRLSFMIDEFQAQIITPPAWPLTLGYGPWVEELWANYLSNALKYGGQPPQIELGFTMLDNEFVRFWVQDNGSGLTPEQQTHLFTPFTRLNQVRAKGHGLGLSIVQRITEKLGGEVGVESQPGHGSRFFFTLPAAESHLNNR